MTVVYKVIVAVMVVMLGDNLTHWLNDLQLAKERLIKGGLALVIAKDSKVLFESGEHGILPFVNAVELLGAEMINSSVADRVVGKAIALLCAYVGVRAVYASILSRSAKHVLNAYGIYLEWGSVVEHILDARRSRPCPFEMAVEFVNDPTEAYRVIRELLISSKGETSTRR